MVAICKLISSWVSHEAYIMFDTCISLLIFVAMVKIVTTAGIFYIGIDRVLQCSKLIKSAITTLMIPKALTKVNDN